MMLVPVLLLLAVSCSLASEWYPYTSFSVDMARLQGGHNLLFLSLGSEAHISLSIRQIRDAFNIKQIHCLDACKGDLNEAMLNVWSSSGSGSRPVLIAVTGAEDLRPTERSKLNFAYSLVDTFSHFANLVVVLAMHDATRSVTANITHAVGPDRAKALKRQLANALNDDSVYFNGLAFTGRISRFAIENTVMNVTLPSQGCDHHQEDRHQVCANLLYTPKHSWCQGDHCAGGANTVLLSILTIGLAALVCTCNAGRTNERRPLVPAKTQAAMVVVQHFGDDDTDRELPTLRTPARVDQSSSGVSTAIAASASASHRTHQGPPSTPLKTPPGSAPHSPLRTASKGTQTDDSIPMTHYYVHTSPQKRLGGINR